MSSSFRRALAPSNPISRGKIGNKTSPETVVTRTSLKKVSAATTTTTMKRGGTRTSLKKVGTKPWIGGLTLTSSGLRDFDAIVGGGQPLGTAMLIEEDRWTQDLAFSLTRYWCAEAVSQGQMLSLIATRADIRSKDLEHLDCDTASTSYSAFDIPTGMQQGMSPGDLHQFLSLLPKNLHVEKKRGMRDSTTGGILEGKSTSTATTTREPFAVIEEGDDFEEEDEAENAIATQKQIEKSDAGLKNAWQYKISVQRERLGQVASAPQKRSNDDDRVYCHSYDLSGKMEDQNGSDWFQQNDKISVLNCSSSLSCNDFRSSAILFYQQCLKHIESQLNLHPDGVIRMLLANAPVPTIAVALPLLLSVIRSRSLPVIFLVTVRPWSGSVSQMHRSVTTPPFLSMLTSLRRSCDAVFTCEGFGAMTTQVPPEFSDLAGLFSIRKLALQSLYHFSDSTTNRRPPANRYGMKRDRRKLHLRMLHLPPEDFSAGGSSVGSGVRSGAGRKTGGEEHQTALKPGMGCASNNISGRNSGPSLEF